MGFHLELSEDLTVWEAYKALPRTMREELKRRFRRAHDGSRTKEIKWCDVYAVYEEYYEEEAGQYADYLGEMQTASQREEGLE